MTKTEAARIRRRDARTKANARKRCKHDGINRVALGNAVRERIATLGLSRDEAAIVVKDAASQMSRLMTFHDDEFSADRLVKMLARLGGDVDVVTRTHRKGSGIALGRIRVLRELRNGQRHVIAA